MKTITRGFFISWFRESVLKTYSVNTVVCFITLLFLFSCSNDPMLSRPEAERSLKVLNSDLTNFLSGVSDSEASKAVEFVWGQASSPVPFKKEKFKVWPVDTVFSLQTHGGAYKWDSNGNLFRKFSESDSVILNFPSLVDPDEQMSLIISEFETEAHLSRPAFPVRMVMELLSEEEEIMKLFHEGELQDNLPYSINSTLKAGVLDIRFHLHTSRISESGTVTNNILVRAGPKTLAEGSITSEVKYTSSSYYLETITPDLEVFDMRITGTLFYGDIDPTSENYMSSFNDNCGISLFDRPADGRVGLLQLGEVNGGEQFDYFILFNDGSSSPVGEYLLVLNKLLNYKYQ